MSLKIKDSELEALKALMSENNEILSVFNNASLSAKASQAQADSAFESLQKHAKKISEIDKELNETYGAIELNPETGEYTVIEE